MKDSDERPQEITDDRYGLLVQREDAWFATRKSGFDSPAVHSAIEPGMAQHDTSGSTDSVGSLRPVSVDSKVEAVFRATDKPLRI